MRHRVLPLVWVCVFHLGIFPRAYGQDEIGSANRKAPPIVPALQEPVHVAAAATLLDGTEISLRLASPVKIKEVKVGDKVPFVLNHDLYYKNILLAKTGENVEADVVEAGKARWASRGSKLAIQITGLSLLNGQTVPLRGYTVQRGGVGNAPKIADAAVRTGPDSPAEPARIIVGTACPMCANIFEPASLIFFLAPGSNRDIKEDSGAPAYVDGNFPLDLSSFNASQSKALSAKGTVQIVRGHYGWPYKRDLYCNGVPLVHLNADHRFDLTLDPGYYRFTINPTKTPIQIYLAPGTNTNLIASYDEIEEMNEKEVSINSGNGLSFKPFKHKSAGDLLKEAKPVDRGDIYASTCFPLHEVFDGATPNPATSSSKP